MSDRTRSTVLIADHESDSRRSLALALEAAGFTAAECSTMADAMSRLEGFAYDGLVVDVRLADGDGLDVLDEALTRYPDMRAVVTARFGSVHHAVRALKRGAADFLIKPIQPAQIVDLLRPAAVERRHPARIVPVRPVVPAEAPCFDQIVGSSPAMKRLFHTLSLVSPMNSTILLQGETGTGKELVARTIHRNSPRRDQPFVAFNAAAIPEGLAEAELFGHVKGAFTGAIQQRIGRFEAANGGTLFIDEVSSMPLSLQSKLLRALQEREVERIGSSRPVKIDVRVVAATNVDLRQMVKEGTFREDLFYRLSVVRVELPPLRARLDDVPALAHHFVLQSCRSNNLAEKVLSQDALRVLMEFSWPGNIRHLQNAVEYAVAMSGHAPEIPAAALPEELSHRLFGTSETGCEPAAPVIVPHTPEEGINFSSTMSQVERELILRYLQKAGGNKRRAARLLSLSRTTLIDKLQRLGVTEPAIATTAA
ncbi:MAG: sigma-54-dependent Fis family transcriptional regulator [Acidobacteria bacterium]|nr:sigma-54-dependent Fis family transcriptional regulator [Acidobacteriota bacterium]